MTPSPVYTYLWSGPTAGRVTNLLHQIATFIQNQRIGVILIVGRGFRYHYESLHGSVFPCVNFPEKLGTELRCVSANPSNALMQSWSTVGHRDVTWLRWMGLDRGYFLTV